MAQFNDPLNLQMPKSTNMFVDNFGEEKQPVSLNSLDFMAENGCLSILDTMLTNDGPSLAGAANFSLVKNEQSIFAEPVAMEEDQGLDFVEPPMDVIAEYEQKLTQDYGNADNG